jgi:hypothetical protein
MFNVCRTLHSTRIPQLTLGDGVSEGQTWNSEDIRLCSFTVFFGSWQAVVMEFGCIRKAPMCAVRLEAVTYWLCYGRCPSLFAVIATAESGFNASLTLTVEP